VAGAAVTIPALRRIVPAGTLTARRGVPAASAAAFLASAAFFAIDGFLTLMLTETRGLSWWQSRVIVRLGARRLTALGGASVALADAGTISIEAGLAGAFAIGIVAAVLLTLVARRLPDTRPGAGVDGLGD